MSTKEFFKKDPVSFRMGPEFRNKTCSCCRTSLFKNIVTGQWFTRGRPFDTVPFKGVKRNNNKNNENNNKPLNLTWFYVLPPTKNLTSDSTGLLKVTQVHLPQSPSTVGGRVVVVGDEVSKDKKI